MEITQNQANFSKFSIQNAGTNLYGQNENTASTEMGFIQKLRKILPNRNRRFKDKVQSFQRA
jgi:hypothetical protein